MLKIENTEVFGWDAAIRGMRNPLESWAQSDNGGSKDQILMRKLVAAGSDHAKFLRMIHVQCDISAPMYWWKEADTYKIGTVRNSCSTMHKITAKEFTLDDFVHEHLNNISTEVLLGMINLLNSYRDLYISLQNDNDKEAKDIWWQLIQLLPSSYMQRSTMDFNYAVLRRMYHARKYHKQDEWRIDFCNWVKTLPFSDLLTQTGDELVGDLTAREIHEAVTDAK